MNSIFAICYSRGPNWVTGKPVFERPLQAHLAYMKTLRSQGRLLLEGPFIDDQGGLVVVIATGLDATAQAVADDPAIRCSVMVATAHPWKVLAGEAMLTGSVAAA